MKKTPTLFERDFENNPKHVTRVPNPVCDWVFAGEGTPTRKYDGTCTMFDGVSWFKRREVKPGKTPPPEFIELNLDANTGKRMGWMPLDEKDVWHWEAIGDRHWAPGTYELCGPRIRGRGSRHNPEDLDGHILISHAETEVLDVPRDFEGLREWMRGITFEGIVFHHPDGRMAKIKKRDFDLGPDNEPDWTRMPG